MNATTRCLLLTAAIAAWPFDARAAKCVADNVPAATLLFPYFEVNLRDPAAPAMGLSVTNHDKEPTLATVVIWSDFAIITQSFQIEIPGNGTRRIDLRRLFKEGKLPDLACDAVQGEVALPKNEAIRLRRWHESLCVAGKRVGSWQSSDLGGRLRRAKGYVTVDVANLCSALRPGDAGYFVPGGLGVAGNRNVLSGEWRLAGAAGPTILASPAVAIEAFPGAFASGDYTFYRNLTDKTGADDREPLGTTYRFNDELGLPLLTWRDPGVPFSTAPIGCHEFPRWSGPCGVGLSSTTTHYDDGGHPTLFLDNDTCPDILPPVLFTSWMPYASQMRFLSFRPGSDLVTLLPASDATAAPPRIQGWIAPLYPLATASPHFLDSSRGVAAATQVESACGIR